MRAVQLADRLAWYAYRAEEVVRDEVLRAWLDPTLRPAVIEAAYARQTSYLPGGATYERGLFDWEQKVLDGDLFPKRGRVLLGAAGGGRELRVLGERGYEVVAFEPNATLRAGAEEVAKKHARCRIVAAGYEDLVRAATTRSGPLAASLEEGPFEAIILGWGSLTHVLDAEEHAALLRALRVFAPGGPVLISFFLRTKGAAKGKAEYLRGGVRKVLRAFGGRAAPEGLAYETNGGFVYWFTEDEIHALAFSAGYEVGLLEASPFPHAILLPLAAAS